MRRRAAAAVAVVAVPLLVGGCDPGQPDLDVRAAAAGAAAPAPGDVLVDGGWPEAAAFVAAAAADGRPSVVNLFASWCAPCERELPVLAAAADANPDVAFLGVDTDDLRRPAERFVADQPIDWPTLFDPASSVRVALEGRVLPVTAFFDADGALVDVVQVELDAATLDEQLARLR